MTVKVKEIEKEWLSRAEAQKYLGMGQWTIYRHVASGELTCYKHGTLYFKKEDLDAFMEKGKMDIPRVA